MSAAEDEDFADDVDDDVNESGDIQLGFVERGINSLFANSDWSTWDGGKIGGKPIWLNYERIPSTQDLKCRVCSEPMLLLVQIYCPLDSPDAAFHRCLYVFCCRKARCIEQGSTVCLRCQIPKGNPYYPLCPDAHCKDDKRPPRAPVCAVCGGLGAFTCSKCRSRPYCSRIHQKLDWKTHKISCDSSGSGSSSEGDGAGGYLFEEFEVIIEEENLCEDKQTAASGSATTEVWEDAVTEGGEGEEADAALRQADYNAALGNREDHTDPVYMKFLTRVSMGGADQVLRYCCANKRGVEPSEAQLSAAQLPLAVSSVGQVDAGTVPPCNLCGAPRTFEFQIMPQLLHFLNVDKNTALRRLQPLSPGRTDTDTSEPHAPAERSPAEGTVPTATGSAFVNDRREDLDWGSLDVFTCSRSCEVETQSAPYVPEFVWMQPSPMRCS